MNDAPTEATISRVFDATREELWKYFTEPEYFAKWFGTPPYTTPVSTVSMDLRPGGEFRSTMVHETDGSELPFTGHFVEIVEPQRIVQTLENVGDPNDSNVETLTTTLVYLGDGKTQVTYHQSGHLPEEEYRQIEAGVNGFYDRLGEALAE